MSMLAEPRRKQKIINLRAKNTAWSNDNTKFGQRMLERMGWSAGKGLGAKEDGIVEHVVARYKNDEKGLGYEDRNDQWTKHEDDFNSLLAELSHGSDNKEKLHSGVSLELKSKKSKVRVHYHKFMRGKDLSRYSDKDLACIFGKKTLRKEDGVQEFTKEEIKVVNQIFTEKGSMEEYFKNKMASVKSVPSNEYMQSHVDDEKDFGFQGFSGSTIDTEYENSVDAPEHRPFNFHDITTIDKTIKKKEKKNKKKNVICQLNACNNLENNQNESVLPICHNIQCDEQTSVEKSKKAKNKKSHNTIFSVPVEEIKLKKKKKIEISSEIENQSSSKKKKKKVNSA